MIFALIFPVAKKIQFLKTSQTYFLAFALYLFGMSLYMISAPLQLPATFVHAAFFILGMVFRKNGAVVRMWSVFFVLHLVLFSVCYCLASETSMAIKILRYTLMFFVNIAGIFMTVLLIQKFQDAEFFTGISSIICVIFNRFKATRFLIGK